MNIAQEIKLGVAEKSDGDGCAKEVKGKKTEAAVQLMDA